MQQGEESFTPPAETKDETVKSVSICAGVCSDGTLNNRTNIDQRLAAAPADKLTEEELAASLEVKGKMSAADIAEATRVYNLHKPSGPNEESSYEGYYTNVEKLERYLDLTSPPPGYDKMVKTYVEGSGTMDLEGDKKAGFAFAKGESGLEAKVERALREVVAKIAEIQPIKRVFIKKVTLLGLGFSRGAAGTRNFIHKALFGDESIKARLEELGYKVGVVDVRFVGLFDTVSSFGYLLPLNSDNTRALNLDAIAHADAVVQLAAADEHRTYFALTDIASAGGKGRQYFLPGVHSDIGGGYRDNATEKQVIYRGWESTALEEQKKLIAAGWYEKNEIELTAVGESFTALATLSVERKAISNGYSKIPLHLMAGYVRENKINIHPNLERGEVVPDKLTAVHDKIKKYIASQGPYTSKPEDWHGNDDGLPALRHGYFHFSARIKMGHNPRFKNGKRTRKIHEG